MRRDASPAERHNHDGSCRSAGGPLRLQTPATPPIDDREVELAIRRLRLQLVREAIR